MIKISEVELESKCQELHSVALAMGIPEYYRAPDSKFVKDFLKDVELDNCYFRNNETKYYPHHMFKEGYAPIVESGGQVAFLDTTHFEIRSKDKSMSLNMARPNSSGFAVAINMVQTTEEGLYWFRLFENKEIDSKTTYNCELSYYPAKEYSTLGRGYKIVSGDENWNGWMIRQFIPIQCGNLVEEDIVKLANKVYCNGLPHIHEMAKTGGILEITEEDRIHYDEVEYKDDEVVCEMDSVVDKLVALEDVGFELSPEQKNLVDIYENLYSKKFRQFKDEREVREARQQEVRQAVVKENERKEEWFNSADNPSNKRIEELKYLRRQIQGLESLREIAPELLSDYQNNLVEKGNIFFDMFERSKEEKHEVDTGMSSEIREWYQEHYTNEENTSGRVI